MQLVVTSGPDAGQRMPLREGQGVVVGRQLEAQLRINDQSLSRRHCLFELVNGSCVVQDLTSRLGTFVNDQRVTRMVVPPGAVIRVGTSELRLELETVSATLAPGQDTPAPMPKIQPVKLEELLGSTFAGYDLQKVLARG